MCQEPLLCCRVIIPCIPLIPCANGQLNSHGLQALRHVMVSTALDIYRIHTGMHP